MAIVDRAKNLLTALVANGLGQQNQRPLIFVTHSLGGLVVKQALEISSRSPNVEWSEIVKTTNGVVFIATPNSGSDLANLLEYVAGKLTSVSVEELRNSNPNLLELNRWYVRNVDRFGIQTLVFCETQKTGPFIVVTQASADPGIPDVEVSPMDHDHVSITKPESRQALMYIEVRRFVSAGLGARQLPIPLDTLLEKLETQKNDPETVIQGFEGGRVKWPVTLHDQVSGATPYYEVASARDTRVKHRVLFYVQEYHKLTPTGPLTFEGTIDTIRYNSADGEWVLSLVDSAYTIP